MSPVDAAPSNATDAVAPDGQSPSRTGSSTASYGTSAGPMAHDQR